MTEIIYERESDAPENWQTNIMLFRNDDGEVIKLEVPDDTEGES